MFPFMRKHKIVTGLAAVLLLAVALLAYRMKGPYRSYRLDFVKPGPGEVIEPGVLEVGVAIRDITPDLTKCDPWTDADQNSRYEPKKGDTYEDVNGNGKFDAVWLAGFSNNRPATGVHDRLWARAIALRNNGVTLAMVTIDSIGMFQEAYIKVRKSIDPSLGVDHVMFSATHDHEAPDTMGIWSYSPFRPDFDDAYLEGVLSACKEAVEEAAAKLGPAEMICAAVEIDPEGFVKDTREPQCCDRKICCMRFVSPGTDETIATVVSWGNHAEALGSGNTLITSDFPHYLRQGLEDGVLGANGTEGFGGTCLYFQGSVGGLMTPLHLEVPHRDGQRVLKGETFEKAEALGENVAIVVANALRSDSAWRCENPRVAVAAKTIYARMQGLYKYAIMLGLVHPGYFRGGKARSEVNAIRIGDVEILTCPGELYPEIAEGKVEAPEGADFGISPVETPGLRSVMTGKMNLVVNLANDEIGYIIPKSQWDTEPPFTYGRNKAWYGEENSGGPDVAPVYHREAVAILERLHSAL